VEPATEDEFRYKFPECEIGAMPPFGNICGMEVYVAVGLAQDETIAFNAGPHTELIKLACSDFYRLVMPRVGKFTSKREASEGPPPIALSLITGMVYKEKAGILARQGRTHGRIP